MTDRKALSRRQFLQRTGAAAGAALAAPMIWRKPAHAANDRINMGFIGIGNMGSGLLRSFVNNEGVQVLAISDVREAHANEGKQRVEEVYADQMEQGTYAGCDLHHDFRDLLARDDIDAVVIATPDHWHGTMAVLACQAGKDVYCEKPLSLDVADAQAMVEAARRYQTVFQTGSQQRSDRNFRIGCELVRNGYIGELQEVYASVGRTSHPAYFPEEPLPDGVDWDRWLGPSPWYPFNSERMSGSYSGGWRLIRDTSGGMVTDWGAHHFDIAQWGLGMDGSNPVEIIPPGVDGAEHLTFIYDNGIPLYRGGNRGVRFVGAEGEVVVDRGFIETDPAELADIELKPDDIHLYESNNHHQNWLDCIRSRRRPVADVAIGASSVTTCHLGNIALWTHRAIQWDPERQEIIDDPVASRWLARPKRDAYCWI